MVVHRLESFKGTVISHAALVASLTNYARPNDKISELINQGVLIHLRKGLYALNGANGPSRELMANHLHGPSYVSCQWALGHYGMLSESTAAVTSICLGRSRTYENSLGRFTYHPVPQRYYAPGQVSMALSTVHVAMACPEKALCDLMISDRTVRLQSTSAMHDYLFDNLRLLESDLEFLNIERIEHFAATGYKRQMIKQLLRTLRTLS